MATFELDFYHEDSDGNLLDLDSAPTLSDVTGTYGVWRGTTTIVDDGTAMTRVGTGHYQYELTYGDAEAADTILYGTTYSYAVEYTYDGLTDFFQSQFTSSAASSDTYGSAGWACDQIEAFLSATGSESAGVALRYVQAAYDEFLAGRHPAFGYIHPWSFLNTYQELTLQASVEGTASGTYTASASGRQLGTIAVTATTAIFTSAHVGCYLTVEDVGTYRITAYSSTTLVTVQVLTGQTAANFTSKSVWLAGIYDLASDFGGMNGRPTYMYSSTYLTPYLRQTSLDDITAMWKYDDDEDEPTHYAVVAREFASTTGQRWQLWVAPRSENTQVIRIPYRVRPDLLTDSAAVWFLGGREHVQTILQIARKYVELWGSGTAGVQAAMADRMMEQSIDFDTALLGSRGALSIAGADTGLSV